MSEIEDCHDDGSESGTPFSSVVVRSVEYHVVRADGSGTIASFDRWGQPVRDAWHAAAKKHAVNLLCMWSCGCLRRALVREVTHTPVAYFDARRERIVRGRRKRERVHTDWRTIEHCEEHRRKP